MRVGACYGRVALKLTDSCGITPRHVSILPTSATAARPLRRTPLMRSLRNGVSYVGSLRVATRRLSRSAQFGPLPAPITLKELDKALLSFAWPPGSGADRLHPRHIYYSSRVGNSWLRILLTLMEGSSTDPTSQSTILFNLVGKQDGGTRLIALLGSIYRI